MKIIEKLITLSCSVAGYLCVCVCACVCCCCYEKWKDETLKMAPSGRVYSSYETFAKTGWYYSRCCDTQWDMLSPHKQREVPENSNSSALHSVWWIRRLWWKWVAEVGMKRVARWQTSVNIPHEEYIACEEIAKEWERQNFRKHFHFKCADTEYEGTEGEYATESLVFTFPHLSLIPSNPFNPFPLHAPTSSFPPLLLFLFFLLSCHQRPFPLLRFYHAQLTQPFSRFRLVTSRRVCNATRCVQSLCRYE